MIVISVICAAIMFDIMLLVMVVLSPIGDVPMRTIRVKFYMDHFVWIQVDIPALVV